MVMPVTYSPSLKHCALLQWKVREVFSKSIFALLCDIFDRFVIHLILNSRITLVRKFFVLTSRILSGTCGLVDILQK